MNNYSKRFQALLNYFNITRKDVAKITGLEYRSVRAKTASDFSRWAKFAVWVFEEMIEKDKERIKQEEILKGSECFPKTTGVMLMKKKNDE